MNARRAGSRGIRLSAVGAIAAVAAAICTALCSPASGGPAWLIYPEAGSLVARHDENGELGMPAVISRGGATCLPPALAIGPDGLPAAAWLGEGNDLWFSECDGTQWSPPELVSPSRGVHRGVPTLAAGDVAMVAWAEAGEGGFEDIWYAVRREGRWSEPLRAHEPNVVPDIMPSAAAGPGGTFSLSWKGFDGERYVARSIGDQVDVPSRGAAPPGVYERALDARLPPETAVAWTGPDALSRSVYLKQLADEQAAPTDEKQKGASRDGVASVPGAITIVAFGDSITYGRGSESNGPRTGYPVYLRAILSYNYPGRIFTTVNEGVPGETTEGGLGRIDDVLIESRPQYILIMEGTNDMFMGVSFETVQENLKQMAFRAAARGAVPILATIIPTDPHTRPEQYLRTRSFYTGGYVQSIHDYYSIPYADQWNAFCSIPDFAETLMDPATGNHPNDNGYRYVMAPEWYDALAPVLGLPFDPVPPQLDLDESAQSVTRGASEEFSYALVPSNDMVRNAVDCYVALRSPDGALTFYNPNRQPTPRTTPIARKVLLTAVPDAGHLLQLPIDWGASLGTYTLYLVTVRALHDPWITSNWTSNLAQIQFEVKQ